MDLAESLGVRDAGRAGRGEAWLAGVSQLIACLDEGLRKEPRAPGDFELLAQQLRGQRRREAEKVVAQRMKSSRAVAEAQSALGRFLDKRAASVQEASCAASDAQGRLQRLQEQSNGVRAVALRKAQAQVADVEQRALHEARARNAMLDRRESEIQALKRQTASLSTACNACCGDLMNISQTLEAAASQASEVNHEKSLVQTRCLRLDAREAALQTMERAWKEVARSSPISARSQAKALDAARDHLVRALLRDKVFTGKMNQLLDGLQEASPAAKNFPSPASDPSNDQSLGPSEAKEEGASADSTADAGEGNENLSVVWSPVNGSAASQGKERSAISAFGPIIINDLLGAITIDCQKYVWLAMPTNQNSRTIAWGAPFISPVVLVGRQLVDGCFCLTVDSVCNLNWNALRAVFVVNPTHRPRRNADGMILHLRLPVRFFDIYPLSLSSSQTLLSLSLLSLNPPRKHSHIIDILELSNHFPELLRLITFVSGPYPSTSIMIILVPRVPDNDTLSLTALNMFVLGIRLTPL
ncbi:unnamed protein product [Symbiodinium natans]|uniref:Uncharacterized protein n=1 Tax=Symbiodinium natans TaxID=878477 RepID=A0A812G6H9_9DINO|nr:unnamed protein product [Symbiodinium natans]